MIVTVFAVAEKERLAQEEERNNAQAISQEKAQSDPEPWWRFEPKNYFVPGFFKSESDEQLLEKGPFDLQMRLAKKLSPVEHLGVHRDLEVRERSLIGLLTVLKTKLAHNETTPQRTGILHLTKMSSEPNEDATGPVNASVSDGSVRGPLQTFWPNSRLFEENQISSSPYNVKSRVRTLQNLAYATSGYEEKNYQALLNLEAANRAHKLLTVEEEPVRTDLFADVELGESRSNLVFRTGPDSYNWQIERIAEIYKKTAQRSSHHNGLITYILGIMPQNQNEVIKDKLRQIRVLLDTGKYR